MHEINILTLLSVAFVLVSTVKFIFKFKSNETNVTINVSVNEPDKTKK